MVCYSLVDQVQSLMLLIIHVMFIHRKNEPTENTMKQETLGRQVLHKDKGMKPDVHAGCANRPG